MFSAETRVRYSRYESDGTQRSCNVFRASNGTVWTDCDDVILQNDSGTLRPAWPTESARLASVERGDAVTPHVQTATDALGLTAPGVTLAGVLAVAE